MRTVIVLSAGALIAVFLIGAAIYGVVIGDFSTLGDLWDGLKELLLFIAGFYFGKTKPHRK